MLIVADSEEKLCRLVSEFGRVSEKNEEQKMQKSNDMEIWAPLFLMNCMGANKQIWG